MPSVADVGASSGDVSPSSADVSPSFADVALALRDEGAASAEECSAGGTAPGSDDHVWIAPRRYWHMPLWQVFTPGHCALVLQPGTQTPLLQIMPEPSLPGLQSPSLLQVIPPLPVLVVDALELEAEEDAEEDDDDEPLPQVSPQMLVASPTQVASHAVVQQ
jgi:hypothetical protein